MLTSLEREFGKIEVFGPLNGGSAEFIGKVRNRLYQKTTGRKYTAWHNWHLARRYAKQVHTWIDRYKPDLIISSASSTALASMHRNIPYIAVSDATFSLMLGYYERYTDLTQGAIREGIEIETAALHNASLCVYPSTWAAKSAVNDYLVPEHKVLTIPFGANLTNPPTREEALIPSNADPLKLLFVGVDWERKGGRIALEILSDLLSRGIRAELTICGCIPSVDTSSLPVSIIPFLDKNDEAGERKMCDLFLNHHLLILPSWAECFGIVYCEAAACGIPSLAYDTGGVGGAVYDGINGYKLPLGAGAGEFTTKILDIMSGDGVYDALKRSSRDLFESSHNWENWANSLRAAL